ncbi:MAG: flagellar basal body rod protein FlgB [Deltaproteobacteria bacterium]|nr:flagellar basal body rod protein FlgB [Deltaproteobacteria bacterium]
MALETLFGNIDSLIVKSLDRMIQRQAVLAANISNADTPGYKAKDITFGSELKKAMATMELEPIRTNPLHMIDNEQSGPDIVESGQTPGVDGNNVDLERELVKADENALRYRAVSEAASRRLRLLRLAVTEGGR